MLKLPSRSFCKEKSSGATSNRHHEKSFVTLEESEWEWLDEKAEGNRSAFIREVIWRALGNQAEWSNHACLGYMIKGLENLDYDEEVKKLCELLQGSLI